MNNNPNGSSGKPWSLRDKGAAIFRLRGEGKRWEEIAVLVGASKTGVMEAYKRFALTQGQEKSA